MRTVREAPSRFGLLETIVTAALAVLLALMVLEPVF
jgi:hypothetical protein